MTEQEAIEEMKCYRAQSGTSYPEEIEVAIKALEEIQQYRGIGTPEEVIQMKRQNIALRNRCKMLSGGQLCIFCPIKCEERVEEFRNVKGSVVDERVSASKGYTGNRRIT